MSAAKPIVIPHRSIPVLNSNPALRSGQDQDPTKAIMNLPWYQAIEELISSINGGGAGGDSSVTIDDVPIPGTSESTSNFKGDNVNVRMWGALVDGVTDDTTALQRAINWCAANSVTLMIPSGILIASRVLLSSGLVMVGRPGATIKQKANSAINSTPFIINSDTSGGNSDIEIQGITFDANSSQQTATNVDNIDLLNVSNITFRGCSFVNAVRAHIFGQLIAGITLEDCTFNNWATGNVGAVYLASRASNNFGGPGGAISKIRISGGTFDGRTSHSSCLKIDGEASRLCTDIQIDSVYAYPGDAGSTGTLGIELFSGAGVGYNNFGILGCHVIGENNTNSNIFGISLGGRGGQYGSVIGNVLQDCRAFGIEVISSFVDVIGNESSGCGTWSIDAGAISLQAVNISYNKINEPTLVGAYVNAIHAIAHTTVGGPWNIDGLTIIGNECRSTASANVNLIIIENQTAGVVKNITIAHNKIYGLNTSGGSGISINAVGSVDFLLLESNLCVNLQFGINNAGTNGRYLWNRFNNVGTQYTNAFGSTDMKVEVDSALGHFNPQSVRVNTAPLPVLKSNGDVSIPYETMGVTNLDTNPANPNVFTWNGANFGGILQGAVCSVNSRWNGFPNWVQSSTNAHTRALFAVFGAGAFDIRFGAATNAGGATPGTSVFRIEDNAGSPEMFTTCIAANSVLATDGGGKIVPATGLPPSGAAGGDLSGTYPNPTVAGNVVKTLLGTNRKVTGGSAQFSSGSVTITHGLTTVDTIVATIVNSTSGPRTESCQITGVSGSNATIQSSVSTSSQFVAWFAIGT